MTTTQTLEPLQTTPKKRASRKAPKAAPIQKPVLPLVTRATTNPGEVTLKVAIKGAMFSLTRRLKNSELSTICPYLPPAQVLNAIEYFLADISGVIGVGGEASSLARPQRFIDKITRIALNTLANASLVAICQSVTRKQYLGGYLAVYGQSGISSAVKTVATALPEFSKVVDTYRRATRGEISPMVYIRRIRLILGAGISFNDVAIGRKFTTHARATLRSWYNTRPPMRVSGGGDSGVLIQRGGNAEELPCDTGLVMSLGIEVWGDNCFGGYSVRRRRDLCQLSEIQRFRWHKCLGAILEAGGNRAKAAAILQGIKSAGDMSSVEIECILPNSKHGLVGDYISQKLPGIRMGTDGSIRTNSGFQGAEIRAVMIRGEYTRLRELCKLLATNGVKVNTSCGLHVHFDHCGATPADVELAVTNWESAQPLLYTVVPPSRRGNRYCRYGVGRDAGNSDNRYHGINYANAYRKYQTIELRMGGGTANFKKIVMWIETLYYFKKFGLHIPHEVLRGQYPNHTDTTGGYNLSPGGAAWLLGNPESQLISGGLRNGVMTMPMPVELLTWLKERVKDCNRHHDGWGKAFDTLMAAGSPIPTYSEERPALAAPRNIVYTRVNIESHLKALETVTNNDESE